MKYILLSGGSGKRLWPLSNDARSKQFLKVLSNPNNEMESMVQRVVRQIKNIEKEDIYITTSKSQVEMITSQLGNDINLLIEPERKDTFPAIALAASYLFSVEGVDLNEVVTILPVDSYVEAHFFDKVAKLEEAVLESDSEIALLGVKPTYPSEKYGYIVPESKENEYLKVSHFTEKPSEKDAKKLIDKGSLWNCGVFSFKLETIIKKIEENNLPLSYEKMLQEFHTYEKISFDYAVTEKAKNIICIPYNGYWKDLGTWNTLTEEMSSSSIGQALLDSESCNTHVINELDIPVTVIGIKDAVVAASPDGILVTDKQNSPKVKSVMDCYSHRPMYEERRWGWYKVLDFTKTSENEETLTKRIYIQEGKNLSYQTHRNRAEYWTILSGQGKIVLNDQMFNFKSGDNISIFPGDKHAIKANKDVELIEVQIGTELIEEDIQRYLFDWKDIQNIAIHTRKS